VGRGSAGLAAGPGVWQKKTATAPPAQATICRFTWALEQQAVALQLWARGVLQAPGQHQAGGLLEVSPDGRHLKGSARGGVGDKAIALVLAHLRRWGLLRPRPGFPGRGPDGPGCPANRGHHFLHRKDSQAELKDGAARRTMCAATTRYLESAKKPIVNHQELSAITESRRPVSENPSAFR